MPSKENKFFGRLWENINGYMNDGWIDSTVRASERRPDAPFADTGVVLKRLLALGASKRELALLARSGCYDGTFSTLYDIQGTGLDREDLVAIHEGLLSADPSGLEGRPGSAPAMQPKPKD